MNIPMIYYHSIALKQHRSWPKKYLTLELRFFEDQMKYLAKNKYKSIFLDEYFNLLGEGKKLKGKYVCITFDDGFVDNYIYAFPILKKYNLKGTIFVSPDFVDQKSPVRKTLDDYWRKAATHQDISRWGYLSWEEMRIMENSGLIDIQSHTMTHTKYCVNDNLIKFHYPGIDAIYMVGNIFPEAIPYYIGNNQFETLLPYGYPYFETKSAIIAKRVTINKSFQDKIIERLKTEPPQSFSSFTSTFEKVKDIYEEYKRKDLIINNIETEKEFEKRVEYELAQSKKQIESHLNKKVYYCCWPHGDYTDFSHQKALDVGYKGTTIVLSANESRPPDRFYRTGLYHVKNNRFLSLLKTKYKIGVFRKTFPWYSVSKIYAAIK